jgi:hypothetical protein
MLNESARTTEEPINDGWRYIGKYDNEADAVYVFSRSLEYHLIFYYLFLYLTSDAIIVCPITHQRQYLEN